MKTNHLTFRKLFTSRVLLFVFFTVIEILLMVFLFSGKLDDFIEMTDTLKALFGCFFGFSLIFSFSLFKNIFFDYRESPEFRYNNILKETELKYSIFKEELDKQKYELTNLLKEQEKNELLKERLFEIELQALELQKEKFSEIRRLLEHHHSR